MYRHLSRLIAQFLPLLIALAFAAGHRASAQSASTTISGRVTDAATQAVLRGATVTLTPAAAAAPLRTATDANGEFTLTALPGTYTLAFDYLGLPPKSQAITLATAPVRLAISLGDETLTLAAVTVEATRTGQARALNQQRAAQNLTNIISSDFSGQFPDKNIADAMKRLPGVTVETDRDTGGSEGRYVTIRGMSADFNAVTIDGMRVNATDSGGITRRVPLDVVSSEVADQIEVSKTLLPSQDADSIGGAVNVRTRSAFSSNQRTASLKAGLNYTDMINDYTGGYPYQNPGHEVSATVSDLFGAQKQFGLSLAANHRAEAILKQRNSTTGWLDTLGYRIGTSTTIVPLRAWVMDSYVLQHFFDDVKGSGLNGSFEWRPNDQNHLRFAAATNIRDTNRGRQRAQVFQSLVRAADKTLPVISAPTATDDTYTNLSAPGNTVRHEVRDFDEVQKTSTVALTGESSVGDTKLDYLVGYNFANWDGNRDTALQTIFQSAAFNTSYSTTPGNAPFTSFGAVHTTTGLAWNNPAMASVFTMRSLFRGSSEYWDNEFNAALNASRAMTLADMPVKFKSGLKVRDRTRDKNETRRDYNANAAWSLTGYTGQADIPSLIANYRATSTSDGHYDFGYFLDPAVVRKVSDTLISRGLLVPTATNDFNSIYNDYSASEKITAGYLMGEFKLGRLAVIAGVRAEQTNSRFEGYDIKGTVATRITPERDYTTWMPGLHLRYDVSKAVVVRGSYNETIARPTFNQLNPNAVLSTAGDAATLGNINLKPVLSSNLDLSVEHYLGSVGSLSAGVFHKELKNPVYRQTQLETFRGEPNIRVTTFRNAPGGSLTGVELGYDSQFKFLPAPLDGFGVSLNYTHIDSELDTGLLALAGTKVPLFDQVNNTINASLRYDRGPVRARLSLLKRSGTFFELATDAALGVGRFQLPSTTLDFTASYKFWRNWTIYGEVSNLTNKPTRAYNGSEALRQDYNEYNGMSGVIGFRWNL